MEDFITNVKPGEERDTVKNKLDEIKQRYHAVLKKTKDKDDKISKVVPLAQKFTEDSEVFSEWLKDIEEHVEEFEPVSCDEEELNRHIKQVKVGLNFFSASLIACIGVFQNIRYWGVHSIQ